MNNTFSPQRLFISLREFWEFNKLRLIIAPIAVLLWYVGYFLWPDNYLHVALFHPELLLDDLFLHNILTIQGIQYRLAIFFLIPVFIILCSNTYLNNLNNCSRTALVPITKMERILTLYIYNLAILLLIIAVFTVLDWLLISHVTNKHFEQVNNVNISNGYLYKKYDFGTYFQMIKSEYLITIIYLTMIAIPLYHLSMVFFKKNSFFYSAAMYILLFVSSIAILLKYHQNTDSYIFHLDNTAVMIIQVLVCLIVYYLLMRAFYSKLKERQL